MWLALPVSLKIGFNEFISRFYEGRLKKRRSVTTGAELREAACMEIMANLIHLQI